MGVLKRVASWTAICSLQLQFQQKFKILLFGATEFVSDFWYSRHPFFLFTQFF